jgi:hypothetical protein
MVLKKPKKAAASNTHAKSARRGAGFQKVLLTANLKSSDFFGGLAVFLIFAGFPSLAGCVQKRLALTVRPSWR